MKKGEGYKTDVIQTTEKMIFYFSSIGEQGEINKIIEFAYLYGNLWNLGFGDIKGDDWEDNVISNNNDFRIILQTIANTVHDFFEKYPEQDIQIVPLDYQRKLLYNRLFQQRWHEIDDLFIVKGIVKSDNTTEIVAFNPKIMFDEFVICKKKA